MQAFSVVPVDLFQAFPFDLGHRLPAAEEVDDLGFEQSDGAFTDYHKDALVVFSVACRTDG